MKRFLALMAAILLCIVQVEAVATQFNISTQIKGILPVANGGTGNAFFTVSGPASSAKTYTFANADSTIPSVIASGTSTLTGAAIAAAVCQTAVTTSASGAATTDSIIWAYNAAPGSVNGLLTVSAYPTANNVNFLRCNPTAASRTGTAIVINWKVVR